MLETINANSWEDSKLKRFLEESFAKTLPAEVIDAVMKEKMYVPSSVEVDRGFEHTTYSWEYWAVC